MRKIFNEVYASDQILKAAHCYKQLVILDSQSDDRSLSRYTIIAFNPQMILEYDKQLKVNGTIVNEDPLLFIEQASKPSSENADLIFSGGFIGVIRYQMLEDIYPVRLQNEHYLPKIEGGIYEQAIIIDHEQATTTIFNNKGDVSDLESVLVKSKASQSGECISTINNMQTKEEYKQAILKTKEYIKSGDVYEINYTTGFKGMTNIKGEELFTILAKSNPAPYAAYLQFAKSELISSSPELFFKCNQNKIKTQPMKGTMPRGKNRKTDEENLLILQTSEKDKTELTMIIDLMRNDLSKICEYNSVVVENPFAIKKYPTVFQQVADVCGVLKPKTTFKQIIESLFPSGSITGAPKLRSIEVIDELEMRARESYTGAIGFYSNNSNACFNVAIRTIDLCQNEYTVNVGGAIVWDSTIEGEYDECKVKAKALLSALGVKNE